MSLLKYVKDMVIFRIFIKVWYTTSAESENVDKYLDKHLHILFSIKQPDAIPIAEHG